MTAVDDALVVCLFGPGRTIRDDLPQVQVVEAFRGQVRGEPVVPRDFKAPLYRKSWGFKDSWFLGNDVRRFRRDIEGVLEFFRRRHLERAVDELGRVIELTREAERLGLGIYVCGP